MIERLRLILSSLGISQKDFAERIGITPSGLSDVLNGRTKGITKTIALSIQAVYSVNSEWLLNGNGSMFLSEDSKPSFAYENPLLNLQSGERKAVEQIIQMLQNKKPEALHANEGEAYPHAELREIPQLGNIAAGILTEEVIKQSKKVLLPRLIIPDRGPLFMLKVRGDSMKGANIHDGDYAILRPVTDPSELKSGAIVAALVDGENTLKKLYRKDGGAILRAANAEFKDIEVRHLQELVIQGHLKYLIKKWHDDE